MIYGWSPGVGDSTVFGWFTVLVYFLTAALCLRAGMRDRRSAGLWGILCLALVAVGIGKQIDLQMLVTAIGRHWAMTHNWYGERHWIQYQFVWLVLFVAVIFCGFGLVVVRRRSGALQGACIGFVLLCGFFVIRATSFEDVDRLLDSRLLALSWNNLLELGGIAIIAGSAACARAPRQVKQRRRRRRRTAEPELAEPSWLDPSSRH